jgi:hypothetical protein
MAEAYLFSNGNAMYFNDVGEQLSELQGQGFFSLKAFVERYPAGRVFFSVYNESRLAVPESHIPHLAEALTVAHWGSCK